MAALRVGMRVKKVRGSFCVGLTGVVSTEPVSCFNAAEGMDFTVKVDKAGINDEGRHFDAGDIGAAYSSQWEPIHLADDKACEEGFKRDLDRLLERQGVAA